MIVLPRKKEDGKPLISYSQVKLFNDLKSFNLGVEGVLEYMVSYFYGYTFADKGWGAFGQDVEDYITEREKADLFTDKEKEVLHKVKPLGVFADKFYLDFGDFELVGIIDDRLEDWSEIRDYKTASKNSKKQYYEDNYKQLDIYALKALEITGKIPKMEVCIVERKGNLFRGGGREKLTVGDSVWCVERETSEARLTDIKQEIVNTVGEISEYYKLFLELNK